MGYLLSLLVHRLTFYPRDAVLAMILCLSVSVSVLVTSRTSTKIAKQIELVFAMEASLQQSYSVL